MTVRFEIGERLFYLPFVKQQPLAGSQVHNNAFLVRGDRKSMLIDAGAPSDSGALMDQLASLLGPDELDYVFLSHMDMDHIGAVPELLRRYPRMRVVGQMGNLSRGPLHGIPSERFAVVFGGQTIELGNRALTVQDGFLADGPTQWLLDSRTLTCFTSDAFGVIQFGPPVHFAEELPAEPFTLGFQIWQLIQFTHLPLMDVTRYRAAVEDLRQRGVRQIASVHGPVIREDVARAFELAASLHDVRLPPPPPIPDTWKLD